MSDFEKVVGVLQLMLWGFVWILSKTWPLLLAIVGFTALVVWATLSLT